MSQRTEKIRRQVDQLRADVDALQAVWLAQELVNLPTRSWKPLQNVPGRRTGGPERQKQSLRHGGATQFWR